jgi:DNA-directed RNA polymerase sigma subunit (sigma70/sigma32)
MEITHAQLATWLDGPIPGRRTAFQQRGRDQMVAVLWWRFFDSEPRSRAWIAAQLSRSPTRVYQIEAKGLRMLRHRSRRATFDDYRDLAGTPFYDAVFDW